MIRIFSLKLLLQLHQEKAWFTMGKLVFLQRQHKEAVARLSKRLVEIYTSERTSSLSVVLESGSFSDMLDQMQ